MKTTIHYGRRTYGFDTTWRPNTEVHCKAHKQSVTVECTSEGARQRFVMNLSRSEAAALGNLLVTMAVPDTGEKVMTLPNDALKSRLATVVSAQRGS